MKTAPIADFFVTEKCSSTLLNKCTATALCAQAARTGMVCVPVGATQVERRAIRESAQAQAPVEVFFDRRADGGRDGAGLPVSEATGSMVVDIGGKAH